jgi:hypothetical protein
VSTSITTADPLAPGTVVRVWSSIVDLAIGPQWMRVVSTTGTGPFTSEVRALGWWERRWLAVCGYVRRVQRLWLRRVWWPVADWVADRYEAWRQR